MQYSKIILAGLLSSFPQGVNDRLGECTAADPGGLAVPRQLDAVEAAQGNFDATLELAKRAGGAMLASDG